VAELVSLDCWAVSQRAVAAPEWCESLDHIPEGLLFALEGAGYTPAEVPNPLSNFMGDCGE
jgi:hypothetical protein